MRQGRHRLVRLAVAVLALFAGGSLLSLPAAQLKEREVAAGLHRELPGMDREDALSRQLAFFTLGGLRSLAAEILSLDATRAWLDRDWARMEKRWRSVTNLAPQRVNYWASAARDLAVNATSDAQHDSRLGERERAILSKQRFDAGVEMLELGIAANPQSALLHCRLGELYSDLYRFPQFRKAAEAYHRAVELGAAPLYARLEFYNLCRIRGEEARAYELGRRLFAEKEHRQPSVRCLMFVLQKRLDIPAGEALGIEELFGTPERAEKELQRFLNNSMRFPTYGVQDYLDGLRGDGD